MELPACPEVGACHSEGTSPGTVHLIRDYCREFFVSKGMIADFAIHDKGSGNLHTHILFTMRAMDETGKWLPKSRKIYGLDENGERIRLPSGRYKTHKVDPYRLERQGQHPLVAQGMGWTIPTTFWRGTEARSVSTTAATPSAA